MATSQRRVWQRHRWHTACYNAFVRSTPLRRYAWFDWVWRRGWECASASCGGPVGVTIHGRRITVNFGYRYPILARQFPTYNDPLVAAIRQAFAIKGGPVSFVDVGAAVSDTALLLLANCPG